MPHKATLLQNVTDCPKKVQLTVPHMARGSNTWGNQLSRGIQSGNPLNRLQLASPPSLTIRSTSSNKVTRYKLQPKAPTHAANAISRMAKYLGANAPIKPATAMPRTPART